MRSYGARAPTVTENQSAKSSISAADVCGAACALIGVLFLLGLLYALPIAELIMGSINRGDVNTCDTSLPSATTWLIVKGSVGLFISTYTIMVLGALRTENDFFVVTSAVLSVPFILSLLFMFAWLIVGSVMFWRDCIHLGPDSLNTMMWCSLIIGYVSSLTSSSAVGRK